MTFRFSPFLLVLALLIWTGVIMRMAFGLSAIAEVIFWIVLWINFAWAAGLLRQAVRTGVAAFPVFVWFLDVDKQNSSLFYFDIVGTYCIGLLCGLAIVILEISGR